MIIGVLGLIDSGKGTVGDYLEEKHGFYRDSFASSLKDATANVFGWPRKLLEGDTKESRKFRETIDPWWAERLGVPELTPRWVLQQIGSEVFRDHFHPDIWIASLEYRISQEPNYNRIITDVRFPNEIEMIKKQKGFLIEVRRGILPQWWQYAVDWNTVNREGKYGDESPSIKFNVHSSEWAWAGTEVDFVLDNSGTLDQLKVNIDFALTMFKGPVKLDDTGIGEK